MQSIHHAELVRSTSVREAEVDADLCSSEVLDNYIERFGIGDARELIRVAHNRPVQAEQVTLLIRTEFITQEAQNALLKVLEEPPQSTRFVFVVPIDFFFLPTLLSRFNESTGVKNEISSKAEDFFSAFIKNSYQERLEKIEKASKDKDVDWQRKIKQGLIQYILVNKKYDKTLADMEFVARTLLTRGASNKMLLEHLALIL